MATDATAHMTTDHSAAVVDVMMTGTDKEDSMAAVTLAGPEMVGMRTTIDPETTEIGDITAETTMEQESAIMTIVVTMTRGNADIRHRLAYGLLGGCFCPFSNYMHFHHLVLHGKTATPGFTATVNENHTLYVRNCFSVSISTFKTAQINHLVRCTSKFEATHLLSSRSMEFHVSRIQSGEESRSSQRCHRSCTLAVFQLSLPFFYVVW